MVDFPESFDVSTRELVHKQGRNCRGLAKFPRPRCLGDDNRLSLKERGRALKRSVYLIHT